MATTESLHPGIYVRQGCLVPHELSVTDAPHVLGVGRQALSNLLGGRAGGSAEMAIRLSKAVDTPTELWMQRQLSYDLAQASRNANAIEVWPLTAKPAHPQPELF